MLELEFNPYFCGCQYHVLVQYISETLPPFLDDIFVHSTIKTPELRYRNSGDSFGFNAISHSIV